MSQRSSSAASRRVFLKGAALVPLAMAGGIGLSAPTEAAPPKAPKPMFGKSTKLDLGMAPHAAAAGAVIIENEWGTFVTYQAMASDEDGNQQPIGTAVIELVGCKARTFSYSTDLGLDGRPYSYFDLKPGAVYEVTDSPWLLGVEEDAFGRATVTSRPTTTKTKRVPLRHFVFTFGETTFQCVAEKLNAQLSTESFGTIAAKLDARGLVNPPPPPAPTKASTPATVSAAKPAAPVVGPAKTSAVKIVPTSKPATTVATPAKQSTTKAAAPKVVPAKPTVKSRFSNSK